MRMTGITKQLKGVVPACLCLLVIYYFYKYISPVQNDDAVHKGRANAPNFPAPTEAPSGIWLLAVSSDPSVCFSLVGSFPQWNVLIVIPKTTDLRHGRCRFLTIEEDLTDENDYFVSLFGKNSSSTLILKGILNLKQYEPEAVFIAPVQEDLSQLNKPLHMQASLSSQLLHGTAATTYLFSADGHFGCSTDNQFLNRTNYRLCRIPPAVMEVPANVDQIHSDGVVSRERLPRSITCDGRAPPVMLQYDNYALTTFETGLFRYDYIWVAGLDRIIAATKENRLLVNLGLQKVIWLAKGRMKIYIESSVVKNRDYDEKVSHTQALTWMFDIDAWSCDDDMVNTCVINLFLYLKSKELIKSSTLRAVQNYFAFLTENGYHFPYIVDNEYKLNGEYDCDKERLSLYPVKYESSHGVIKNRNFDQLKNVYQRTCSSFSSPKFTIADAFTSPWLRFPHILLLVVFNKPHYEAIPYIELLYGPFFPHIIFCGPGFPNQTKFKSLYSSGNKFERTFIPYGRTPEGHVPGAFNYACAKMVMEMQYNVDGYLVMADDTLLLVNNIKTLKKDSIWFLPPNEMRVGEITKLRECKLGMCDFFPHWAWWADYQRETIALLNNMSKEQERSLLIYKCYQQLVHLNGAPLRPSGGYSDVYYIPQRLASDFAQLSKMFLDHGVFLEIAVPTIIRCLEYPGDVLPLKNTVIWTETRDQPWKYFNRHDLFGKAFYHPAKWSNLSSTHLTLLQEFYCEKLLPFLHDPLERLPSQKKSGNH